ncbi:uncharacterized protein N7479_000323 [Penicillium vulpinum]|uniref:uncharacterized protein n=1 Tax=Penicillium vulpinum TaxID=29845 RepID=UPI002548F8EA|nr:uncharacterized protein N7479_000323 [Penicillium vulpinum]KAJ5970405.1 hypothetical protein N7479_000323 [Penicillium vulpinum]
MKDMANKSQSSGSTEAENCYKLVVAVDYGTTFTGVAYVITNRASGQEDSGSISLMQCWPPGVDNQTSTPSLISYTQNERPPLWGFEFKPGMQSYGWTKLLLDRNIQHSKLDDELLEMVTGSDILKLPDPKKAVDAVADYLSQIYAHITDNESEVTKLLRSHGRNLSGVSVDFWFMIPAIWSKETQVLMREAIHRAGFGSSPLHQIFTTTEPEAAALAVFDDRSFNLQCHDGALICDCGGGTVDTTTYYVTDVYPKTSFEPITTAMGAKCGVIAIDSRFYELLSRRLDGAFNHLPMSQIQPGSLAMNKFEDIKRASNGEVAQSWGFDLNLDFPETHLAFSNERTRRIVLQVQDVRGLYEPVLSKIYALILSQIIAAKEECARDVINVSPDYSYFKFVLVGGFSASPYLQGRIQHALNRIGNISVLVPQNPGQAIVHGAALQVLRGYVPPSYKFWRNYGLASLQPFHFSVQNKWQRLIAENSTLPVNLLPQWILHKDQRYPKQFQKSHTTHLLHREQDLLTKAVEIYESNLEVAPQHFENSDAHCIDYITCHFNGLDLTRFPHQTITGQTVYYLELSIRVSLSATDRMMHLIAFALNREIGRKDLAMPHY